MKNVVQLVFVSRNQLLLAFRQNTEAFDQYWGFPSGRIEDGESPLDSAEREALEETSVSTKELNLAAELVDPSLQIRHYFYLCFDWVGKIENAEPNLCRELRWFNLDELPEKCTPITYVAMKKIKNALRDHQQRT
ncbi:NUDIX domain-containing protein [Vibrio splendidus]|uniref:NUDIX domain-containing protein n=1 Tax=Vibrio splendidus TaxID=29497 RepID=UPI0002F4E1E4|nr:NUDIX domain-containing protein [Vibrio splendidus]OEF44644.1 DNA mismatch repair protein MutT [Vibrio splendidus 1S-124]PMK37539.1 DNA mismatch repair protein MutT [Vibrio splendidus]PTQ19343.1 NUDIX domain-containing protein [Vibrio splendidus]